MSQDLAQQLTDSHRDLQRWFLFYQECLLLGQDSFAQQCFSAFSHYLSAHIQFEDSALFPFVQQHAIATQWPMLVYTKEHEKILALLEKNSVLLDDYTRMHGREKRLALLELLNTQRSFIHMMEHHEQREEQDMFIVLTALDTADLSKQWQAIELALKQQYQAFDRKIDSYLRHTL